MESFAKRLQEMKQIADFECVQSKRIIGITSYAASKFQALIQLLRSPIGKNTPRNSIPYSQTLSFAVIIVGAQNILEAHTIAVLTTNLEHLILIDECKTSLLLYEKMLRVNVFHRRYKEIER